MGDVASTKISCLLSGMAKPQSHCHNHSYQLEPVHKVEEKKESDSSTENKYQHCIGKTYYRQRIKVG